MTRCAARLRAWALAAGTLLAMAAAPSADWQTIEAATMALAERTMGPFDGSPSSWQATAPRP